MIDSDFLATLRRRYRCQPLLTMVQLEQVCPGWWPTQTDLAEQLGIIRSELNANLRVLSAAGLVGKVARSNSGGTWIYWVKKFEGDKPAKDAAPAWVVRDQLRNTSELIRVDQQKDWALWRDIPYATLRSFLSGHQKTLDNRWTLVRTPFDSLPG